MIRDRKKSGLLIFSLIGLLVCGLAPVARGQDAAEIKKVLVLYWDSKDFPGNISFDQGFQAGLSADPSTKWELYSEYLDSARFPGERQTELLHDYLAGKYSGQKIDVVIATPDPALNFLLKYRANLFTASPIVFVVVQRPAPEVLAAGAGLTGIIRANTHRRTIDLALKLHPDTRDVFIISGTPERDKRFENLSRQALDGYENRVRLNYLTDLPVNELVNRVKDLPRQSVILYVWQRAVNEDDEKSLQTYQVLEKVRQASSVPIYGMGSRNIGYGIVGGYVQDSERNGLETAEIVRRILHGARAQDIPVDSAGSVPMFDWRELRRWNISESSLPNGSVVRFKELTIWEQYKLRIIGAVALFILQTLIITLLLFERRRRRLAKEALDRLNVELETRIEQRTAALNAKSRELEAFAYSVAHDLKAPLRGIDGYSRLLLEEYAGRLEGDGESFLQIIQSSTDEMNELIDDLLAYSRLERRELHTNQIELRPIVRSLVEEKRREEARSIDFVVDINGGTVLADASGLSQSLRNYLDNAVKFTRKVAQPRIEVGAKEKAQSCVVWVRDNGIGFDMKYHDRIFDIFQRLGATEDYPGTGIGLAIVRKAMERMGGRAWAESQPGAGATFYLEIPK